MNTDLPTGKRKATRRTPKNRTYARAEMLMMTIAKEFLDGASMRRLSRKHSLPVATIEFVIRMKTRTWTY